MAYPVYVIANGQAAEYVFNALAAFCGANDFKIVVGIAAFVGLVSAVIQYSRHKNPSLFAEFFGLFFLVTVLLVGFKMDIQIIDITNPMGAFPQVDNVPIGVGMPATIISETMAGLTQFVDDVFHMPDDMNYTSTGMLYGAKIMEASLSPPPVSKDLQQMIDDYYRQCILPDIMMNHKYTADDLNTTTDLFSFLSAHASPLRGIYVKGNFEVCSQAIRDISTSVNQNLNQQLQKMQSTLSTSVDYGSAAQLGNDIQTVYSYYLNSLSADMSTILMQNTMINASRQAVVNNNAAVDNNAAQAINLGYSAGQQSMLLEVLTVAKILTDWLPFIQMVAFLIGVGVFPLIILFLMVPGGAGFNQLREYFEFFVFICSWPVIFAICNFIGNVILHTRLGNRLNGLGGITLSNIDALQYMNTVAYGIAGFCTIFFTLAGIYGVRKLGGVMQGAAQNMVSFGRGSAGSVASSLAEGNISQGNMNYNNSSANKHDFNKSFLYGMSDRTNPNTGMTDKFYTHDGHSEYIGSDASNFTIGGNYTMNFANESSAQLQEMASSTQTAAKSTLMQASSSLNSNFQKLDQFTHQISDDQHLQKSFSHDESGQFMSSYQTIQSSVEKYGESHGWSHQQINDVSKNLAFSMSGGVRGEASIGGEGIKGNLGGSVDLNRSARDTELNQATADFTHSLDQDQIKNLDQQRQNIQSYMSQVQSLESQGKQLSTSDQVIANISKDLNLINQANAEYSQAEQYESMANHIQNASTSFNQNMMPQFEKWLKGNVTSDPVSYDAYQALINKERGMSVSEIGNNALSLAENKFVASQMPSIGQVAGQIANSGTGVPTTATNWQKNISNQVGSSIQDNFASGTTSVNESFSASGGKALSENALKANEGDVVAGMGKATDEINQGSRDAGQALQSGKDNFDKNSKTISDNKDRGLWATELNNAKKPVD